MGQAEDCSSERLVPHSRGHFGEHWSHIRNFLCGDLGHKVGNISLWVGPQGGDHFGETWAARWGSQTSAPQEGLFRKALGHTVENMSARLRPHKRGHVAKTWAMQQGPLRGDLGHTIRIIPGSHGPHNQNRNRGDLARKMKIISGRLGPDNRDHFVRTWATQ